MPTGWPVVCTAHSSHFPLVNVAASLLFLYCYIDGNGFHILPEIDMVMTFLARQIGLDIIPRISMTSRSHKFEMVKQFGIGRLHVNEIRFYFICRVGNLLFRLPERNPVRN